MKAISVWQPWASLLFAPGEFRKIYETRPRSMGFTPGERIAIHAAKSLKGIEIYCSVIHQPVGRFIHAALDAMYGVHRSETQMPLGCIIGTVEIVGTFASELLRPSPQERAFGDWSPGRVAIGTKSPILFAKPIPFIGKQGVFRVDDAMIKEHEHANS